jgi:adenosylcobyric acid synthase
VTAALFDMFCGLNGRTVRPRRVKARARPATSSEIQGTGSDVGKSLLVAGLARAFTRRGLTVRPFKPHPCTTTCAPTSLCGFRSTGFMWTEGATRAARAWSLMASVLDSFERLRGEADIVLVEGAGSPAEVNLRQGDIANMGFARATGTPVVLVSRCARRSGPCRRQTESGHRGSG